MKIVTLNYIGYWSTEVEVPDDWELTRDNVIELIADNRQDFDFQDGGALWDPTSAEIEGSAESIDLDGRDK
jgi:hypothetical protein